MGVDYSVPGPGNIPKFSFSIRPGISTILSKDYYFEVYWNFENATIEEKQYLTSLSLPLYLEATSKENINLFLKDSIHNPNIQEQFLILARDSRSHQPKGMISCILSKDYYLEDNYSFQNEYLIISGTSSVALNVMGNGMYSEMIQIYGKLFFDRSNGKNYVYFDMALNPIAYLTTTKHLLVYPNLYSETPASIESFLKKLMKKYNYVSADPKNPFVVKEMIKIESLKREKWLKNYENLTREGKYFVDQTQMKEYHGLAFLAPGRLIEGNSLGVKAFEIPSEKLVVPQVLIRDFYFTRPLI